MTKITKRLITFLLGVPIMLSLCFWFRWLNFLPLHVVIISATIIGCIEVRRLLENKMEVLPLPLCLIFSIIPPVASYFFGMGVLPVLIYSALLCLPAILIFLFELFISNTGSFEKSTERLTSSVFLLIYPAFLLNFVSSMTREKYSHTALTFFFVVIFACDSLAWLLGMLFGKNNRGFIKASPNKSIAGFIGGLLGGVLTAIVAYFFIPPFKTSFSKTLLIMLLTSFAAIIGDLVESILKRSVNVKDSGQVILGRGGIMDSMDSIIGGIPIYYFLYKFLFSQFL